MQKILGLLLLMSGTLSAQVKPEVAYIIPEKDLIPEGITYDAAGKAFYVGSIQKRKIVKISADGSVKDFVSPNDQLLQLVGMTVDPKGMLWACNNSPEHDTVNHRSNVNVYRLKDGSLFRQFQISDKTKHLFNDLVIAQNGDVYVTDSDAGMLWRIKNGGTDIEAFTKPGSLPWANGIVMLADQKRLLVCTGSGMGIASVDLDSKKISPFPVRKYLILGMDGMYLYNNQLIGVQNTTFPEGILKMSMDNTASKVEDVSLLTYDHPDLDIPTTGVIVGDYFYFIANSQLHQIQGSGGIIKHPELLKDVVILKIKLN
jgi:hypothetical protein